MDQVKDWVRVHQHELHSMLTTADWLQVYGEGVKDYGIDMDHLIRETKNAGEYQDDLEQG